MTATQPTATQPTAAQPTAAQPTAAASRPTGRRSTRSRVFALLLTVVASLLVLVSIGSAPASAAVPAACSQAHVGLPRLTGVTFNGYADAACNQWYYVEVQVKENGTVIRDNYQGAWQQGGTYTYVYNNPQFSCVHGRGYQAVAIVHLWNGSADYVGGYWTTGAPRALC